MLFCCHRVSVAPAFDRSGHGKRGAFFDSGFAEELMTTSNKDGYELFAEPTSVAVRRELGVHVIASRVLLDIDASFKLILSDLH